MRRILSRSKGWSFLLATATLVIFAVAWPARASSGLGLDAAEEQTFRRAARSVAGSVVRIQTVGGVDRVGGMLAASAATTGVVVSEDGYVISSAFNFIAKPTSIIVTLPDGRPFSARLVATDHLRMLTLLKIDASGLTPLRPLPDKKVRVGQWAIAIGRTYDSPEPSVSVGIVSAVNRVWGKAIQTDAKVSPVNYGGPLIDVAGNVLGVVVPLSPSGKDETAGVEWYDSGIGFAIPFEDVLASAERLKAGKDLHPGLLGITVKEGGIDERPAIDVVRFDSPAEKAGLKSGDVILEIDGHPLDRRDEIKLRLGRKYAGDKVAVLVQRAKEKVRAETQLIDVLLPYEPGLLGILPDRQAVAGGRGILVRFVFPHSAAATAGILVGDRIRKWNGADVSDVAQFASMVRRVRPGKKASVVLLRSAEEKNIEVTLTADIEDVPGDVPPFRSAVSLPKARPPKGTAAKNEEKKPKTGSFRDKLSGESAQGFWAYVPEKYSATETWGLIVWISPPRDTMEATVLARWRNLCDERGLIIVAPLPAEASGLNPNDLVGTRQVIEHFLKTYRIDKNRIVVHGFSGGGGFAAALAFENRELVRGLALASSRLVVPPPDSHPSFPFRFFFSCGGSDQIRESIQRAAKVLREMKFAVTLQTTTSRTRTYLGAEQVAELARWVDSLDRI